MAFDSAMDYNSVLLALGIDSLDNMSCEDLKHKVKYAASMDISRPQTLNTLMGWLHEQIKKDAITQQTYMLQDFVNLLTMPDALGITPFRKTEIDLAFAEWQEKDAQENPANRRRYSMAKVDMHELLTKPESSDQFENIPPSSGPPRQAGREGRPALSCKTTASPFSSGSRNKDSKPEEWKVGKKTTGANVIPLGTRKPMRVAYNQEVIEIYDDDEPAQQAKAPASYGSDTDEVTITGDFIVLDPSHEKMANNSERRKSHKTRHGRKNHAVTSSDYSQPPPVNYVCNRCSKPGHWIQLCPTNLDPSYDKPPEPNYRCELCGQAGDHFATLCPQNENEVSLTKQRQRNAVGSKTPVWGDDHQRRSGSPMDRYYPGGHDTYRPDRSPRVWYEKSNRQTRQTENHRELPPYSTRLRLTREWEWEPERGEVSPRRTASDNYRPRGRSSSPPLHSRRDLTSPPARSTHQRKDSDQPKDEGRLAYDDDIDIFVDPNLSLPVPKQQDATKHIKDISTDDHMKDAPPIVNDTPEDIEKVKRQADKFLDALGIELLSAAAPGTVEDPMDMDEAQSESDECNNVAKVDPFIFQKPDGSKVRLIQASQFHPKVVALFAGRDNLIIHHRAVRKTACQMMMMNAVYMPQASRRGPMNSTRASHAPSTSRRSRLTSDVDSLSPGI